MDQTIFFFQMPLERIFFDEPLNDFFSILHPSPRWLIVNPLNFILYSFLRRIGWEFSETEDSGWTWEVLDRNSALVVAG